MAAAHPEMGGADPIAPCSTLTATAARYASAALSNAATDRSCSGRWADPDGTRKSHRTCFEDLRERFDLRVESVATGGAGAMAGLRDGDVVVEVDGHAVRSVAELATRLYGDPPGTPLRFAVVRDGATITTMVVLTDG